MARYTKAAISAVLIAPLLSVSSAWMTNINTNIHRGVVRPALSSSSSPSTTRLYESFSSIESDLLNKIKLGSASNTPTEVTSSSASVSPDAAASSSSSSPSITDFFSSIDDTIKQFQSTIDSITSSNSADGSSAASAALPNPNEMKDIIQKSIEAVTQNMQSLDDTLLSNPTIGPILSTIQNKIITSIGPLLGNDKTNAELIASLPPLVSIAVSATITYTVVSSVLFSVGGLNDKYSNTPYPLGKYDPRAARAYFDGRISEVIGRGVEIGSQSFVFGLTLLSDKLNNKWEENSELRGKELAELLTRLGPTFIKIGQSLSIRTDLLSPAYARGLKTLQDQVPAFDTAIAKEIIEDELGLYDISDMFVEFSSEPVAAASLGQVYKAKLKESGLEVAIKVQRPDIMNQIALDMHFLRELAPWAKRTFNLNTDTVGTVDTWGVGFVDELDYISEAENAEYFMESIQSTPLSSVVFSPTVVEEATTGKVLTTEWVVGERLDRSSNEDVTILCSIAMNTYLTMMLETGVLHCDPHPGNLLRTPDGQLCILDWGMVTRLEPDLQITLIEHMAHLTSADYAEIPRDLLLLGFIPKDKADAISDSGIVEVLADIYGAWTKGGGAAAINVNEVVAQLQDLTEKKGNLFQIPPYFAYIAKSFSVLEGIGLSNDPKYSIINECLPYVSKRLLTDTSERTGGALSTFIFGPEKNDIEGRIIDYDRVEQLISGFGDYTTSASGASLGQEKTRTELIDDLVDQVLDLVATEEETPLQSIFIEQLAKIISASSRSVWTEVRERSGKLPSGRTVLGTLVDPLGLFRTSPVVRMNSLDEQTIETTRNLIKLLNDQAQENGSDAVSTNDLTNAEIQEISSKLVRKVWEKRTRIAKTSGRLATKLLQMTADKLESGEREVYVLPTSASAENKTEEENDGRIHMNTSTQQSKRLNNAKKILEDAEREELILSK